VEGSPVSILKTLKEKLLTLVVVAIVIGALAGVAGHFLGVSGGAVAGVAAGVCGAIGAIVVGRPSLYRARQ